MTEKQIDRKLFKTLQVRLPPQLAEHLTAYCEAMGQSQTGVVREAIREYLEKQRVVQWQHGKGGAE